MSNGIEVKMIILENGKDVFNAPMSYLAFENVVSYYPDDDVSQTFFSLAAKHPASVVRIQVAQKEHLSEETVHHLSNDIELEVLERLVNSQAFREYATQEVIEKFIALSKEFACSVASSVESFQQCDISKLASLLADHPDPEVVAATAGNCSTPKKILKQLEKHSDTLIASNARMSLS